MVVADTGAIVALIDRDEAHHQVVRTLFEGAASPWVVPWAVLPEVDYLVASHLGARAHAAWADDLADGIYEVHWGHEEEIERARQIQRKYKALKIGLVDAIVMAVAERAGATAIATLDLRHFGAVELRGTPRLLPRDL